MASPGREPWDCWRDGAAERRKVRHRVTEDTEEKRVLTRRHDGTTEEEEEEEEAEKMVFFFGDGEPRAWTLGFLAHSRLLGSNEA